MVLVGPAATRTWIPARLTAPGRLGQHRVEQRLDPEVALEREDVPLGHRQLFGHELDDNTHRKLRQPCDAVGIAGRGIVNLRRRRAEIAVSESRFRNMSLRQTAAVVVGADEIAEKEEFVVRDRAAERKSALKICCVGGRQGRKRIARHRRFCITEGEQRAFQLVRSRL